MGRPRMPFSVSFRTAPLLLAMLALVAGIVGMHIWTGGHPATPPAGAPDSTAVVLNDGGTATIAHPPMTTPNHEGHENHGRAAIPTPEAPGLAGLSSESDTGCSEGCGGMTMLNCVLVLALLILTIIIRPALPALPQLASLFRPIPLLLRTAAPSRGPSLVHLSISRT